MLSVSTRLDTCRKPDTPGLLPNSTRIANSLYLRTTRSFCISRGMFGISTEWRQVAGLF